MATGKVLDFSFMEADTVEGMPSSPTGALMVPLASSENRMSLPCDVDGRAR